MKFIKSNRKESRCKGLANFIQTKFFTANLCRHEIYVIPEQLISRDTFFQKKRLLTFCQMQYVTKCKLIFCQNSLEQRVLLCCTLLINKRLRLRKLLGLKLWQSNHSSFVKLSIQNFIKAPIFADKLYIISCWRLNMIFMLDSLVVTTQF